MGNSCDAIIIGAGPAGLAAAAALRARGLNAVILEKSDAVGAVWRRHYDRLHLHTDRARSGLPGLPIPKAYGRYPSRAQVVEYLEHYTAKFDLKPVFNAQVRAIRRDGPAWRAEAGDELADRADRRRRDRLGRLSLFAELAGDGNRSSARSCIRASIAIRPLSPGNTCWSSATAIPEQRLRSTSAKRASMWRSPFAARSMSSRASSSDCRSSPGASPADCFPRQWPTGSTRPSFGSRPARSKNSA